jgi:hypothetical protein
MLWVWSLSAHAQSAEVTGADFESEAEQPALKLNITPETPRSSDGYTLEEMDVRVRRAGIGLGVSALVFVAGIALMSVYMRSCNEAGISGSDFGGTGDDKSCALRATGIALGAGGFVGMITSGTMLRVRKQKRLRALRANWR